MLTQLHGQNADQTREYPLTSSEIAQRLSLPKNKKTKTTAGNSTGNKTAGAQATRKESVMPKTAIAYARMCESELGVPPKIILDEAVEIPVYRSGKQVYGNFSSCDNPVLIGKATVSGSVLQRYEGRTAEGARLQHVVWIAFGRNSSSSPASIVGSVQMIGYNKESGATAFFESCDHLGPWVTMDQDTWRMRGTMPWIDNPEEFNRAFVPAPMQCVQCHQSDPFITNSFINAAKIPGTDLPVIPLLDADSPYHVIGGSHWDMRTINLKDNACFDCHRVGMKTIELFTQSGWDVNEHMPPEDPGSLSDAYQELLTAWQQGPENVAGADWIIPPARGTATRIVGTDYPYQAAFNRNQFPTPDSGIQPQTDTLESLKQRYFESSKNFQKQISKGTMTAKEADREL
ncbi:MAG: hypothetical protein GY924_27920, partial [Planctomycetaceae bacterium]|nr:hypothetical protein [Planctomycetaceae bacterium]